MKKEYKVTLKSGLERVVTRDEDETKNQSLIGLWIWASRRIQPIIIDFNECVISSDEIAMIDRD
jgi:hypothetical protein